VLTRYAPGPPRENLKPFETAKLPDVNAMDFAAQNVSLQRPCPPRALRAALLHAAHKPGVEIQLSQQPMAGKLHPRVWPPERNAIR